MSWIFGSIKKNNNSNFDNNKLKNTHPKPLYFISNQNLYLAAGGFHKTCLGHKVMQKDGQEKGWIVCGTGIKNDGDKFSFLQKKDWTQLLKGHNLRENLNNLNGHFVIVKFNNDSIKIMNDQLGLRDMFFLETENNIYFSTYLHWLVKFQENPEIDLKIYSSFWLLERPLSRKSFLKKIFRLGPGGSASLGQKQFSISNRNWLPEYAPDIKDFDIEHILQKLTTFSLISDQKLTLALSGGVDSRTLLSFLLSGKRKNWYTVTWNEPSHPDVIISKKINSYFNIEHKLLYNKLPNRDKCINTFKKFVYETLTTSPAYKFQELSYYKKINNANTLIDGGAGAILRRALGNKFIFSGKKHMLNNNINGICESLKSHKADIFKDDVMHIFAEGAQSQISREIKEMPKLEEIGLENWVDLLQIRNKFKNASAYAQTRMDGFLQNYMPFAQPVILKKILSIPPAKRKSNRINIQIMRKYQKKLLKFPLVKYDTIIPFQSNVYLAFFTARIKKLIGASYKNSIKLRFLNSISDYVQDLVRSKKVREYPLYNYHKIRNIVDEYYQGKEQFADELSWWLTFDTWRELLDR